VRQASAGSRRPSRGPPRGLCALRGVAGRHWHAELERSQAQSGWRHALLYASPAPGREANPAAQSPQCGVRGRVVAERVIEGERDESEGTVYTVDAGILEKCRRKAVLTMRWHSGWHHGADLLCRVVP